METANLTGGVLHKGIAGITPMDGVRTSYFPHITHHAESK
jgi:hypothetical protein